jgi:DNA-binding transcriptional regulator YdaS (Cro superfamily)
MSSFTKKLHSQKESKKMADSGAKALKKWLSEGYGRGVYLARRIGESTPAISKMSNGKKEITLEIAILIELATDRKLMAGDLCPSMQNVISCIRSGSDVYPWVLLCD